MKAHELIELLKKQPQDALIINDNPRASDEGLGHWFESRYLHLIGVKKKEVDGKACLMFKYSEENDGWQDDSWDAVDSGRFFKVRNLDPEDFVWRGEEVPEKDGNYLCVCQHGKRYTLETIGFYAKKMKDGTEREKSQWGFSCEHIPPWYRNSYHVALWSRKSYKPFKEGGGLDEVVD